MVSIYSSNFLDLLIEYISIILRNSSHPKPYFNIIIEVLLLSGQVRTVGRGFIVESTTNFDELRTMLEGYIENFETQSLANLDKAPGKILIESLIVKSSLFFLPKTLMVIISPSFIIGLKVKGNRTRAGNDKMAS